MDQDAYIEMYFRELSSKLEPLGFDRKEFVNAMWNGVKAMVENDGIRTNEAVFWETFSGICGKEILQHTSVFEDFYYNEIEKAKIHTGFQPKSAPLVRKLRERGHCVVLATSPVYPSIAVEARMRWAGLCKADFDLITSYENCHFTKPNPAFYTEIAEKLCVSPADCVMVGNDTQDDLPAARAGMSVFIVTDYLINKDNIDFSAYSHGDFEVLCEFLENIE